jgi:hypothetical protein
MLAAMSTLNQAQTLNRLHMHRFLLNGDTKEEESVTHDTGKINDLITVVEQKAIVLGEFSGEANRLLEDMRLNEARWEKEFAGRMIDARLRVDSDKSTVAEMQIAFLQMDPAVWDNRDMEPVTALNRIVDIAKASSQLSWKARLTGLLQEVIVGFILVVAFAMVITSKLAKSLPATEKESLAINLR